LAADSVNEIAGTNNGQVQTVEFILATIDDIHDGASEIGRLPRKFITGAERQEQAVLELSDRVRGPSTSVDGYGSQMDHERH